MQGPDLCQPGLPQYLLQLAAHPAQSIQPVQLQAHANKQWFQGQGRPAQQGNEMAEKSVLGGVKGLLGPLLQQPGRGEDLS